MNEKTVEELMSFLGIIEHVVVSGGRVNNSFRGKMDGKKIFLKVNENKENLESEYLSQMLLKSKGLNIPEILSKGEYLSKEEKKYFYLLMVDVLDGEDGEKYKDEKLLREEWKKLEAVKGEKYGNDYDTFSGVEKMDNTPKKSWSDFFRENRWKILIDRLYQLMLITSEKKNFAFYQDYLLMLKIYDLIPHIFDGQLIEPTMLHGDMNDGNYFYKEGKIYLFDSAVFYGDHRYDIACYECYNKECLLADTLTSVELIYFAYALLCSFRLRGNTTLFKRAKNYMNELLKRFALYQPSLLFNYASLQNSQCIDSIIIFRANFNPIHQNHLRIMQLSFDFLTQNLSKKSVLKVFQLDHFLPIKKSPPGYSLYHRYHMAKLSLDSRRSELDSDLLSTFEGNDFCFDDDVLLDLTQIWGDSVVKHYRKLFGENLPIFISCGSDCFLDLFTQFSEKNVFFLVFRRKDDHTDCEIKTSQIQNVFFFDNKNETKISSTFIRGNILSKKVVKMINPNVLKYLALLNKKSKKNKK